MKYIILIFIGLSSLSVAEFTKSSNVVTDDITGLQWQDDTVGNTSNWEDGITLCEGLGLNSLSGWRLPNKVELLTLVDDTKSNSSISDVFENTQASTYWSASSYSNLPRDAWGINFGNGATERSSKYNLAYVRCVRSSE
ncbi:MAG: DUF1566 domain-containing protein [Sulfurovum sp.]|nr:DUF1566 domain-containing protein [Sulfurovum sp.]